MTNSRLRNAAIAALMFLPLAAYAQTPPASPADPPLGPQSGAPSSRSSNLADPSGEGAAALQESASAQVHPAYVLPGTRPLESLVGMTLAAAFAAFGPPDEVFSVRGDQAWEDDVVFYYSDHTYLFWFKDRVWQVRADERYSAQVIGVKMNESRSDVEAALGPPFHTGSDSDIFILPGNGFPVRARLFFADGSLSDLYIYRGDF